MQASPRPTWSTGSFPFHLNTDIQALALLLNLLLRTGRTIGSLSDLIGKRKSTEVVEPTIYAKKPIELSLYRNQIIHVFLSECTSPLRTCAPWTGNEC